MLIGENKTLITKEEVKRLKKALKDKNENKILDWAREFEYQVEQKYQRIYKDELDLSITTNPTPPKEETKDTNR